MDKKSLSETDIRTKFITPALKQAGWDIHTQILEEVAITNGKVLVKGKQYKRAPAKFADYILYYKPNIPIAVIEAKDNKHAVGDGMQQALKYSAMHGDLPFVFSSNGDAFLFHDNTGASSEMEQEISLDAFPSPDELWQRYCTWKGFDAPAEQIVSQDYFIDSSGKKPRYYQLNQHRCHRGNEFQFHDQGIRVLDLSK